MLFESYMTLWHLKMLLLWILANCLLPWYAIWRNKRLRPDPARDIERFKPFIRTDYDNWSYIGCIWTHFFFLPRFATMIGLLCYMSVLINIITIGCDVENLNACRKKFILWNASMLIPIFGVMIGCMSFTTRRPEVDYGKWLGPDWKPHYDGYTMCISNHMGWTEIFNTFLFVRPMPGFVAKSGLKQLPSVSNVALSMNTLFMDRTSKESRSKVFE